MKRVLALILALTMVMALVACGGDKPAGSTPSSTPSNPTQSSKPTEPSKPSEPEKPAEPMVQTAEAAYIYENCCFPGEFMGENAKCKMKDAFC